MYKHLIGPSVDVRQKLFLTETRLDFRSRLLGSNFEVTILGPLSLLAVIHSYVLYVPYNNEYVFI